jgi:hypothetical protein
MTTISSGVNSYLTTYNTTQTPSVSGSATAPNSSASPSQSSVSISLSASSLSMATAYALASKPVNPATLAVSGNTLTIAESVPGTLNANDVIRIYDGTKDITSKFAGYSAATTPAGISGAAGGTLSIVANNLAFNGKTASSLTFTVSKYLGPASYDPESINSNVVAVKLDTTPPATPRATQGTGSSSRIITLTAPEPNTTVEIWDGDPNSGGVQVYGAGASDTFSAYGLNQFIAKTGAYNGSESLSLSVYLRDAAGNLSLPSALMTRPIDSLDRTAGTNTAAYLAARDSGTLASFTPIDIVDRSLSIVENIDALQEMVAGGYAPTIKLTDTRPAVLSLTATQVANAAEALNLLTSGRTPPVPFTIDAKGSFTADQILSLPPALISKIKNVNISLTAQDAVTNLAEINQLLSTETLLPGQVSKFSVNISDTVQAVQDNFDQISTLKSINSVSLTDQFVNPTGKTIPLVLKASQLKSTEMAQVNFKAITAGASDLTLTVAGQTLTVKAGKSLTANQVADAFAGTPPADASIASLTGTLTGYEVTRGEGGVVSYKSTVVGDNVADLVIGGTASRILASKPGLTVAQGGVDLSIINKLPVNYVARITEAKAKDALALQKNAHVVDFTVQDTVDQALLYAKTLNTLPKSFTMTIKDTTGNVAVRTNNLATITKPYTLNLTDSTVDKILQFGKQLKTVKTQFSIKDTVANVLAKSADLSAIKSNFSIADADNVISNDGISVLTNSGMTVSGVKWGDAQFADASNNVKQILINSPIDTIYKSSDPSTFTHVDVLKSISKVLKVNILVDSNTTSDQIDMLQGISDVPGVPVVAPSTLDANLSINGVPVLIPAGSDLATIKETINTAVADYNQKITAHNQVLRTPESLVDIHAELNVAGTGIVLYSNATSAIEVKDMSNITAFTGLNFGVSGARVNGVSMTAPTGSIKGSISLDSGLVATTTATSVPVVALKPGATTQADVTFTALKSGASVTLAGLTFKANVDLTKEQVASAFANIADGTVSTSITPAADGVFSGTMAGWATGAANNALVGYTATRLPTIVPVTLGRDIATNMVNICKAINEARDANGNKLGIKATTDGTASGGVSLTSNDQTPISVSYPADMSNALGLKLGITSKVLQFDCSDAYVLPTLKDSFSSLRNFFTLNVIDTQANINANRAALDQAARNNVMLTIKR